MRYIKVEFIAGQLSGFGYQEVNDSGEVARYVDDAGNEIKMFDDNGNGLVFESRVVDPEATPKFLA